MSFKDDYEKIKAEVSEELKQLEIEMLSGFENYFDLKEYLSKGSKHIRPVMTFLYLKAQEIEVTPEQIKLQSAVELIHNASLLHDDVIDDSKIRRKESSFNQREGNHLAVIGGDFILALALNKLVELNSIEIIKIFSKTIDYMCKGELNQQASKFKIPTLEDYIEKTYQKTGALFEASLKSALLLASSFQSCEFGKNFGIAFQIRDDIINITQNRSDSDVANGIYTAPVIYSGNPDDPYSGIEKAKGLLENYIEGAKQTLYNLPENQYKSKLIELTEILSNE